jgi:hypothetical protein
MDNRKRKIETRGEVASAGDIANFSVLTFSGDFKKNDVRSSEEEQKRKQQAQLGRVHCNYCKRDISVLIIVDFPDEFHYSDTLYHDLEFLL